MNPAEQKYSPKFELVPSLKATVEEAGLNPEELRLGIGDASLNQTSVLQRQIIPVADNNKVAMWSAPSLRELFRGNHAPPPDIDHYPPEYLDLFYTIESNVLLICRIKGDRTDQEMEDIFSNIRRRPDGRSLGEVHDLIWKSAAFMLGMFVVSEAEFDAVFGQLARSCRRWAERPVSRNYVAYLGENFGED